MSIPLVIPRQMLASLRTCARRRDPRPLLWRGHDRGGGRAPQAPLHRDRHGRRRVGTDQGTAGVRLMPSILPLHGFGLRSSQSSSPKDSRWRRPARPSSACSISTRRRHGRTKAWSPPGLWLGASKSTRPEVPQAQPHEDEAPCRDHRDPDPAWGPPAALNRSTRDSYTQRLGHTDIAR
jgi:hypothetical protein